MKFFRVLGLLFLGLFPPVLGGETIVLFNDTSEWYHWGCTATSTALKEGIAKLGFEINAIPIQMTYSFKAVPPFEEFDDLERFERFCEENPDVIASMQKAAAVVITGEGTIHDLRDGPRALLYVAHIAKKFLHKHVEIINHSAYPKDDPKLAADFLKNFGVEKGQAEESAAEAIYRKAYGELDFVAIREPLSQEAMNKIAITSTLSFDCLPLYIRDHYQTPKQTKEKTVVVAGSVAFSESGAENLCRYLEGMAERGFEIQILIGAAAFPARDDQAFVAFLKTHCKTPWKLVTASSLEEWLNTIQQATLLVSGRFHHSIAAFCLDTPFIALNSNTPKVHAICSFLGQAEPLWYSDPQLLTHLWARTEEILVSPPVHHEAKVTELCRFAERNLDGLKALSKGE